MTDVWASVRATFHAMQRSRGLVRIDKTFDSAVDIKQSAAAGTARARARSWRKLALCLIPLSTPVGLCGLWALWAPVTEPEILLKDATFLWVARSLHAGKRSLWPSTATPSCDGSTRRAAAPCRAWASRALSRSSAASSRASWSSSARASSSGGAASRRRRPKARRSRPPARLTPRSRAPLAAHGGLIQLGSDYKLDFS